MKWLDREIQKTLDDWKANRITYVEAGRKLAQLGVRDVWGLLART